MGKNRKKSKHTDEFYESLVKAKTDGDAGWSTGLASETAMDTEAAPQEAAAEAGPSTAGPSTAGPSTSGKPLKTEGMQLDMPASKTRRLGVARESLKRGQRSKMQRLRKVTKQEKAMARSDKVGVRVAGEQSRKIRKLALKHMY